MRDLDKALDGLNEEKAGQRHAEGEWCCKEVLSHLLGDEGESLAAALRPFVEQEMPMIRVVTGLPYYTPARQAMSLSQLRAGAWKRYQEVSDFLAGLSGEQLARRAHVPLLKGSELGEYPTLAQWVGALVNFHLPNHIDQIRNARQQIGG